MMRHAAMQFLAACFVLCLATPVGQALVSVPSARATARAIWGSGRPSGQAQPQDEAAYWRQVVKWAELRVTMVFNLRKHDGGPDYWVKRDLALALAALAEAEHRPDAVIDQLERAALFSEKCAIWFRRELRHGAGDAEETRKALAVAENQLRLVNYTLRGAKARRAREPTH
jgi:hypothetical protein